MPWLVAPPSLQRLASLVTFLIFSVVRSSANL